MHEHERHYYLANDGGILRDSLCMIQASQLGSTKLWEFYGLTNLRNTRQLIISVRPPIMFLSGILIWIIFAVAVPAAQSTDGILNLVKRRLPNNVDDFEFRLLENNAVPLTAKPTNDEYSVSSTPDGKIMVEGNSLIALASG